MSYCQQIGKDRVIFATKEDHSSPSSVVLGDEPRDASMSGLIMANGDINWNCPCLGGMASGPCGYQFREAFTCFHYSESESKGSDCIEKFAAMQDCMLQYPNLYPNGGTGSPDDHTFPADDDLSAAGATAGGHESAVESVAGKDQMNGESSSGGGSDGQSPSKSSSDPQKT